MEWIKGFFIPIIELVLVGGIIIFFAFFIVRGIYKTWNKSIKWTFKYSIMRNKYNPKTVNWILKAIEHDYDYDSAKRFLMLKGYEMERVHEIMWIFDKIFRELKGGKNGQRTARSNKQTELTETTENRESS